MKTSRNSVQSMYFKDIYKTFILNIIYRNKTPKNQYLFQLERSSLKHWIKPLIYLETKINKLEPLSQWAAYSMSLHLRVRWVEYSSWLLEHPPNPRWSRCTWSLVSCSYTSPRRRSIPRIFSRLCCSRRLSAMVDSEIIILRFNRDLINRYWRDNSKRWLTRKIN